MGKHVKNAKAKAKAMAHKATKGALKKLKKSVAKAHAKIAAVKKKAAARMKKAKKAKAKSKAMKKKEKFKKVKKAAKKAAKKAGKKLKKKAKKAKKKAAKKAKKKLKKAKKKTKKVLKKKKKQIKKQKKKVKKMTAKQRRLHARHVGKARAHARFHKLYKKYGMHHSAKRHAALAKKHRVAPAEDLFDTWGMNRKHINHKVADAVSTVAEEAAQVNRIALNLVQVAKIKAQKLKEARKIVMQREAGAHQAVIMASHAMKLAQKTKGEALAAAKRATRVMASHH